MPYHQGQVPRGNQENWDSGGELGMAAHHLQSCSCGLWGPPPGGLLGSLELRAERATAAFCFLRPCCLKFLKLETLLKFSFFLSFPHIFFLCPSRVPGFEKFFDFQA